MMINVGGLTNVVGATKQAGGLKSDFSNKGEKRKLTGLNTEQETKVLVSNTDKLKKAPLKAELIIQLKNLEKEHEALKKENVNNLKTIRELENKVAALEKHDEKNDLESGNDHEAAELDMSFGPRYCVKCGYEAEDGYQLDGHLWSEHEDTDFNSLDCQHCDEKFSIMKDLMTHKKKKHEEKVSKCWHYSNGECPFGDETCWFRHEVNKENYIQSDPKSIKCNLCDEFFKSKNEFMTHRKKNHEENVKMCNLFKKGHCTYHECCWFVHRNVEIDEKISKEIKKITEKSCGSQRVEQEK